MLLLSPKNNGGKRSIAICKRFEKLIKFVFDEGHTKQRRHRTTGK